MAGSSFFKCVGKVFGSLAIVIPVLVLSGCGEGNGPTRITNVAVAPLNLPAGFCDPINFEIECEPPQILWFGGGQTVIVDNPDPSGINQSDKVARMQKFGDQPFGGARLNPVEVPIDFSAGQAFKMKVWSERVVPVTFKLEESNDGTGGIDKVATHGGGSVWEELCFDFTSGVPGNPTIGLTIIFDNNVLGQAIGGVFEGDWTFYYDDITQVESCSDTPPAGVVPDVKLYNPGGDPDLVAVVTEFDSQSVINLSFADDGSYSPVFAVSSGVGYGANVAQVGYTGLAAGFASDYVSLDFKVKGMPNNVIFVKLFDSVDSLRINLTSSAYADDLTDGWYQVSIPISGFNGVSLATGVVFESDNTAPMQFMMLLNDIGFSGTAGDGGDGGDCDDGGAVDPNAVVFDDGFGAGVSFAPFGGSINDVTVDSTEAHSGTASLKVVVPSAEYTGGALVADPARDLSAYDTLTFWAKASDARTLNVAGIGDDASGSAPNSVEVTNLALTTTWTQYTITIPDPSVLTANTGLFHFAEGSDEGVYTIWFDEITYTSSSGGGDCGDGGGDGGGADPDAVVFADDYGTGVSFAPFGGSINDVTVDSTEAYSGTAALKVIVPSAEYTGGALVADPARDLSAYDTLTFWAKASDARTLNVAGIADDASGSAPNSVEVTNLALTTTWTQYTITIPDPSVLTANSGLFHFAEGSDEGVYTIWFDEITYVSSSGGNGGGNGGGDGGTGAATGELVLNGDFEDGLNGWLAFDSSNSAQGGTISVGTPNSTFTTGASSARIYSVGLNQFPLLKLERLSAGVLANGASVTVSFDWYNPVQTVDSNAGPIVGNNVVIVQLLTERTGDNGATAEDLIAPPTFLTAGPNWQQATFSTVLGPDAGGGVSLFFQTNTGGNADAEMDLYIDNVSIVIN